MLEVFPNFANTPLSIIYHTSLHSYIIMPYIIMLFHNGTSKVRLLAWKLYLYFEPACFLLLFSYELGSYWFILQEKVQKSVARCEKHLILRDHSMLF